MAGVPRLPRSGLIASWSRAAFNRGRAIGSFLSTIVGLATRILLLGATIAIFCTLASGLMILMLLTLPETRGRSLASLETGLASTSAPEVGRAIS
jgi:hypothetical protein